MPGPTLDEMVVQSKDIEEGPESVHIEIQEIASKRDMHGAWALSFIITQEFRFYYKKWADIFMGRNFHFTKRTVILDSHYEKQYCLNDCP